MRGGRSLDPDEQMVLIPGEVVERDLFGITGIDHGCDIFRHGHAVLIKLELLWAKARFLLD